MGGFPKPGTSTLGVRAGENMQRQIKDMVPVLKKLLVSSEDKNTHTLNNIKRITEQQINKLEMINRQSPAFPTLTV